MLEMLAMLVCILLFLAVCAPILLFVGFTLWFLIKGTPGETDPNKF
jgi:hypothetical protein